MKESELKTIIKTIDLESPSEDFEQSVMYAVSKSSIYKSKTEKSYLAALLIPLLMSIIGFIIIISNIDLYQNNHYYDSIKRVFTSPTGSYIITLLAYSSFIVLLFFAYEELINHKKQKRQTK